MILFQLAFNQLIDVVVVFNEQNAFLHILCPPEHALIHSTVPIRNSSFFDFNTNWHNLVINRDEAITEKSLSQQSGAASWVKQKNPRFPRINNACKLTDCRCFCYFHQTTA
jgi:hypothetical protein